MAFAEAAAAIGGHIDDLENSGRLWFARNDQLSSARRAARLLLYSAELQAEEYDFFLFQAFDGRLRELRSDSAIAANPSN